MTRACACVETPELVSGVFFYCKDLPPPNSVKVEPINVRLYQLQTSPLTSFGCSSQTATWYDDRMRVEPFSVGSYVHVVKRGARGMPITVDEFDAWRFLRVLYYMNDKFLDIQWNRTVGNANSFTRPERKPIVSILAYTLMPNHMHLLLKEVREGGISAFMQKVGQSMTNHHNEKYAERGSIFQGSYKSRTIEDSEYLQYVSAYIMAKNTFELYPRDGLRGATAHFDDAWKWAVAYPFSSLGNYANAKISRILDKDILADVFSDKKQFKKFCRDVILGGKWLDAAFE